MVDLEKYVAIESRPNFDPTIQKIAVYWFFKSVFWQNAVKT